MKQEIAKAIHRAAEECDIELELHSNYSGRGMFGKQTHAIVGSMNNIFVAIAAAGFNFGCEGEQVEDLILACQQFKMDNMGRNDLVVY